jgi:hypothetical protein
VVPDAIGTIIQQTDLHPDGFKEPQWQFVARMMQRCLVQSHMSFERVRAKAVDLQYVVHLSTRAADTGIYFFQSAFGGSGVDYFYKGH